jgi:hypothetical protein
VLFISHRVRQVTVVARTAHGWERHEYRSGERVQLADPRFELAVDELYDGIELDEA